MPKIRVVRWYVLQVNGVYADVLWCNRSQAEAIISAKNRTSKNPWSIALETRSSARVSELLGYSVI